MSTLPGIDSRWARRAARSGPALAWMGLIFTLSAQHTVPRPPGLGPDLTSMLGHFGVYFVLAILLWWGTAEPGLAGRNRLALVVAIAVLYGIGDEWHQSFVPGRQPDILDVAVDAIGAACGVLAIHRWGGPPSFAGAQDRLLRAAHRKPRP